MRKKSSINRTLKMVFILTTYVPILLLGSIIITTSITNYSNIKEILKDRVIKVQTDVIRLEVEKVTDYIKWHQKHSKLTHDELKVEILDIVSIFRFKHRGNEAGHLFIKNYQGEILFNGRAKEFVGTNRSDQLDYYGNNIHKLQMDAIKDSTTDFADYFLLPGNKTKANKVRTIMSVIPEWQWIIGGEVQYDELEMMLLEVDTKTKRKFQYFLLINLIILIVLIGVISMLNRYVIKKVKTNFCSFKRFFTQVASESVSINPNEQNFSEFVDLATSASRMISSRKAIEERLVQSKEQAELASIAKSEFLDNMSHELRTPMHAILNYSKFGQKKIGAIPQEKILYYFSQIHEAGIRLMSFLNDLLDLSRTEPGKWSCSFAEANINQIIDDAISKSDALLKKKEISIKILNKSNISKVMCDELKITQVVRSLLKNAIDYSPDRSTILIEIDASTLTRIDENRAKIVLAVRVKIRDQGIGIPNDELIQIFDTFAQSSRTNTGAGGKGLGLAICKEIIKSHGGEIWAENNPDLGATLSFKIPLKAANN